MNYELSLLLFSASRGARLQFKAYGRWSNASGSFPTQYSVLRLWRVHPEDERLLWGPVSGKYWKMAVSKDDDKFEDCVGAGILEHQLRFSDWQRFKSCNDNDKRTYLMLLACALQGDGL
jgi:hypothetical protein